MSYLILAALPGMGKSTFVREAEYLCHDTDDAWQLLYGERWYRYMEFISDYNNEAKRVASLARAARRNTDGIIITNLQWKPNGDEKVIWFTMPSYMYVARCREIKRFSRYSDAQLQTWVDNWNAHIRRVGGTTIVLNRNGYVSMSGTLRVLLEGDEFSLPRIEDHHVFEGRTPI